MKRISKPGTSCVAVRPDDRRIGKAAALLLHAAQQVLSDDLESDDWSGLASEAMDYIYQATELLRILMQPASPIGSDDGSAQRASAEGGAT